MCIHGDKSQPERDWVLSGTAAAAVTSAKRPAFASIDTPSLSTPPPLSLFVAEFRSGKAPILIATDVASRGLGRFWGFQYYTITT